MVKLRGFEIAKGFENKGINLPKRGTKFSAGYDFEAAEDITIPSIWTQYENGSDKLFRELSKSIFNKEFSKQELLNWDSTMKNLSETDMLEMSTKFIEAIGGFENFNTMVEEEDVDKASESFASTISNLFPNQGDDLIAEINKTFFKPTLVPTGVKAYMQEDEVLYIYNRSSGPLKRFLSESNAVGIIDSDYYSNPSNDGHIFVQFINFGLGEQKIKKGEKIAQGIFSKYLITDDDSAEGIRTGGHGSTDK